MILLGYIASWFATLTVKIDYQANLRLILVNGDQIYCIPEHKVTGIIHQGNKDSIENIILLVQEIIYQKKSIFFSFKRIEEELLKELKVT